MILAAIGIVVVLLGSIVCTDRIDKYWKNRRKTITTLSRREPVIPPFIWSPTQCIDCAKDGELLNLERRCGGCHELHYVNG